MLQITCTELKLGPPAVRQSIGLYLSDFLRLLTIHTTNVLHSIDLKSWSLRPLDEFFIVMCRLRQGFPEDHLAQLFNVSASTVRRIFVTWVNFMFFKFGQINIWPSRKVIDTMPKSFKGRYKSTRVIIDCTEVRCQMPSSLQLNWELFSAYKNHTTFKGLVGISPSGAVTLAVFMLGTLKLSQTLKSSRDEFNVLDNFNVSLTFMWGMNELLNS